MNTDTRHAAGMFVNKSSRKIAGPPSPPPVGERLAPAKKKPVVAKPKGAPASKTKKVARRPRRSSRMQSKEKLVCRYCGSDDLSPSFKRRRDARCRACFKKRYGSAARSKRARRSPKAKAAK